MRRTDFQFQYFASLLWRLIVAALVVSGMQQIWGQNQSITETAGRFGLGWDAEKAAVFQAADTRLAAAPLTVEMWVKAQKSGESHVFIAHGLQTSGDHWELGTNRDGLLYAEFAAVQPARWETSLQIADGNWHYLAAIWGQDSLQLIVDQERLPPQKIQRTNRPVQSAGFSLGTRSDEKRLTQLHIDDVRISSRARDIATIPELPLVRDETTLYLWDFEESREAYLARWTPGGETNQRNLPYPHRIAEYEFEDDSHWIDGRWQKTVKGPFLAHSFQVDHHQLGAKLLAVFLENNATALFNLRDCSSSTAVLDSQLQINPARFGLLAKPRIEGQVAWYVTPGKSWMRLNKNSTSASSAWQPLDATELDYRGLTLHNHDVVFEYQVADTIVHEHVSQQARATGDVVLRRWQATAVTESLRLTLTEGIDEFLQQRDGTSHNEQVSVVKAGKTGVWQLGSATTANVRLVPNGRDLCLQIDPSNTTTHIDLLVRLDDEDQKSALEFPELPSFESMLQADLLRWGEPLTTQGTLGQGDGQSAWVIDELNLPFDNPFGALFFVSGFDFLDNGDAMLCTAHGEVWRVSGIDAGLGQLQWQRFATGLYQPLGLKILNGQVIVICRDQLLRLEDLNGDGEADRYHSLNHELHTLGSDHAYAMRLESDGAGNLYFLKSSEGPPHGCSLIRWNATTKKLEVVASGFRHPYGLGIGPRDEITVADNEGNWVPSSKIDLIEPGGFYGFIERPGDVPADAKPARPLCFIPKFIDNSCGGQVWVPRSDLWGSYHQGEMLHLSWGRCTLHAVLRQQVGSVWQAATVRLPDLVFRSGSGTARFHPVDGQLYVGGLDGWQTGAVQEGCFSRVRATGHAPQMPESWEVFPNGLRVRYSVDLDPQQNLDEKRFAVERWNYRWSGTYGSFHYRPSRSDEVGHDPVAVRRIHRLDDRTLFVETDPLQLVDQIQLTASVVTQTGSALNHQIVGTINALPQPFPLSSTESGDGLFGADNLVAWCVVPFDAQRRGPRERAAMLAELGLQRLAYDWRDEHIATWDDEVLALRAREIELTAFWAPANTAEPLGEKHWQEILALIDRHGLQMDLWVMLNEGLLQSIPAEQRVFKASEWLQPLAAALEKRQCRLSLYNHGGWSGEPANLVAIAEAMRRQGNENVGIVYNLHHAHEQLPRFAEHLQQMLPYLTCLNLNGMRAGGPKILPIGAGDDDASLLDTIRRSGYNGRIGILDHREELDAAESLRQNLQGLRGLLDNGGLNQ